MDKSTPATISLKNPPQVVTVDELAQYLRIDRKSIYAAIHSGQMPGARRFGRTWRVSLPAVMKWLAKGEQVARECSVLVDSAQI